jgi:hypothetical protein
VLSLFSVFNELTNHQSTKMYNDFTLELIEERFGIKNQVELLQGTKIMAQPTEPLRQAMLIAADLPIRSGKASSEAIVFPILLDLRARNGNFFTIHSGCSLNADKEQGLRGNCDFVLAKDTGSLTLNTPFFTVVQAEKGDIDAAIPQCAAQLIGAKIFNVKKGTPIETTYGCVTTGKTWTFIKVTDKVVVDKKTYYTDNLPELLSAFQMILEPFKVLLK